MSLLTDASLILTPNAYNVGKLYSVIPNTTLGDMDVSRGSSATRVNSGGLIEIARTNLVLYSEQFDNAYWTKVQGGIALAPVVTPNVETAPDGTMTADRVVFNLNGGTLGTDLSSLGSATFTSISITRTQSVYIKTTDGTTKVFTFVSPIGTATTITVTSVYQRFTWTSTGINVSSIRLRLRGSASGEGTATSASIAIWGAQYEDGSVETEYIPTVASIRTKFAGITQDGGSASNIPRLDYTGGGCPSILVEPARTNLFLYSEQFDNAIWVKTFLGTGSAPVVTANNAIAPDGTLTADLIVFDRGVGNTSSDRSDINQSPLVVAATTYSSSFYLKAATSNDVGKQIAIRGVDQGSFSVITLTSQWVRYNRTSAALSAAGLVNLQNRGGTTNANIVSLHAWGGQLEEGANATSYIPTTTAAVPRNADVISKTGITTLIGQTEGTLYFEVQGFSDGNPANQFITLNDGTTTNQIGFTYTQTLGRINGYFRVNGSTTQITSTVLKTLNSKIILKYNSSNAYTLFINGSLIGTATSLYSFSLPLTDFKTSQGDNSGSYNGNIKSIVLYKTALTDDQCILLTGPSFSSYPEMASALIYTLQ